MKNIRQEEQEEMKEVPNLEHIISSYYQKYKEPVHTFFKKYLIDVTASWTFYIPVMAEAEYFIIGLEPLQVFYSRTFATAIGAITMRPYGVFREWWKKKWQITKESSPFKKFVVDTSAMLIFQIPTYSTILYSVGESPKEIAVALPPAALIGIFSGRPYGTFRDAWSDFWTMPIPLTTDHYSRVFVNHCYYQWKNGERSF